MQHLDHFFEYDEQSIFQLSTYIKTIFILIFINIYINKFTVLYCNTSLRYFAPSSSISLHAIYNVLNV